MRNTVLLTSLLVLLGIGSFVAFWCLILKMLSRKGWQRLTPFQTAGSRAGAGVRLSWASLGGVRYQGVIKAHALAEGLALETLFLFRIGHPPLLIPWSAIGPVRVEKPFWSTVYTTDVATGSGGSVSFAFSSDQLARELRDWHGIAGPPAGGLSHKERP